MAFACAVFDNGYMLTSGHYVACQIKARAFCHPQLNLARNLGLGDVTSPASSRTLLRLVHLFLKADADVTLPPFYLTCLSM